MYKWAVTMGISLHRFYSVENSRTDAVRERKHGGSSFWSAIAAIFTFLQNLFVLSVNFNVLPEIWR